MLFCDWVTRMCCLVAKSCLNLLWPHGLWPTRLLCPWDSPGNNSGVACHALLQRIFPIQGSNLLFLHDSQIRYHWISWEVLCIGIGHVVHHPWRFLFCEEMCTLLDGGDKNVRSECAHWIKCLQCSRDLHPCFFASPHKWHLKEKKQFHVLKI